MLTCGFCLALLAGQEAQTLEKLSITVVPTRTSFAELEPVTIRITVENPTPGPVKVPPTLWAAPCFQVQIASKKGEFEVYHPAWMPFKELPPPPPPQGGPAVGPRFRGQWIETIYYKTRPPGRAPARVFDSPGTYAVRVRIFYEEADVVSDAVEVVIRKAEGADAQAAEALKAADLDRFLGRDGKHYPDLEDGAEKLRGFLRSFPGSAYEPYALFGLGVYQLSASSPEKRPQKDFSVPGLLEAARILDRVAGTPDHPYAGEAAVLAARSYYRAGEKAHARRLLQAAQRTPALDHEAAVRDLAEALGPER